MEYMHLSESFNTEPPQKDTPEFSLDMMDIPEGISDNVRLLFEYAHYIADGDRLGEWQEDLISLDQRIKDNPDLIGPRVLLAATLEGMGEHGGASEQYENAAGMTNHPVEKAYILKKAEECAEKADNQTAIMHQNAAPELTGPAPGR